MVRFAQFETVYGKTVFINPEYVSFISSGHSTINGEQVKTTTIHLISEQDDYFSVPWNPVEVIGRLKDAI